MENHLKSALIFGVVITFAFLMLDVIAWTNNQEMMVVVSKNKQIGLSSMKDVILDELNIKELVILDNDSEIVSKSAKPNFKSIGPKFGKKVNKVAGSIKAFSSKEIEQLEAKNSVSINIDGEELKISKEDVEIVNSEITGWVVESEEGVTVAIDTELTGELVAEGLAREFVNRIQNMRKDAGFDVTDRIKIKFSGSKELVNAVNSFQDYISNETLAEELSRQAELMNDENSNGEVKQEWKIGEYECSISIRKD